MPKTTQTVDVYVEVGDKKTFALALDWPGWARVARDEDAALQALYDYGPRYARVLQHARLGFQRPADVGALNVVERLKGNATTDFGAPALELTTDSDPVDDDTLKRWQTILRACWRAFDASVDAAAGKTLRKGPRGGGRELGKIVEHVRDVEQGYLSSIGGTFKFDKALPPRDALVPLRDAILTTLEDAVNGKIPTEGPRGGKRWSPRYFVRRLAWHELDHAWEIEDRAE
jgi:hypothetical protein